MAAARAEVRPRATELGSGQRRRLGEQVGQAERLQARDGRAVPFDQSRGDRDPGALCRIYPDPTTVLSGCDWNLQLAYIEDEPSGITTASRRARETFPPWTTPSC